MENITFTTYKYNCLHEKTPIGWPQTLHFACLRPNTYLWPHSHLLSSSCFVVVLLVSCCCFRHACVAPFCWEVQHGSMNHDSCRHAALLSKRAEHTHELNNNKTRQDNKTRHANYTCLVIDFSCLVIDLSGIVLYAPPPPPPTQPAFAHTEVSFPPRF